MEIGKITTKRAWVTGTLTDKPKKGKGPWKRD